MLVSVVGTQITDLLNDGLGVSLYGSTSVFAVLAVVRNRAFWLREVDPTVKVCIPYVTVNSPAFLLKPLSCRRPSAAGSARSAASKALA